MGLYKQFATDPKAVDEGVWLEYDGFRVKCARAGLDHPRFCAEWLKQLEAIGNPDEPTQEQMRLVASRTYAAVVVKGWQTMVEGEFKDGIEDESGSLLEFTHENVVKTLSNPKLDDFINDMARKAGRRSTFSPDHAAKN